MTIAGHEFWTPESVRAAVAGSWVGGAGAPAALRGGGAIDTRELRAGEIFFALRGENTDGHRYLRQARDAGAAAAVIDDAQAAGTLPEGLPVLRVDNARAALGRLASAFRRVLGSTRFVAVTGSNGKTTTTRMIHACLGATLRGRCSAKSFNNDLGVPLTILGARPGDQYVICEVGMNSPGEIEPLARIIRPDIVVVTSIGRAHLEGLGSLEAVAAEKMALASRLQAGGVVVLNADSPALTPYRARFERVITFGQSGDADLRVGGIRESAAGVSFSLNDRAAFTLPVLGAHNAVNAAGAIAVARRLGVDDGTIRSALASFVPPDMRLASLSIGGISIVNDAYNANPDSMAAALRTLRAVAPVGARRVAVLGDMLEMGEAGPEAHREVGRLLASGGVDLAILVGPLSALAAESAAPAGVRCELVGGLDGDGAERAAGLLRPGDTVLLKASRGMRLERVLEALRGAVPAAG